MRRIRTLLSFCAWGALSILLGADPAGAQACGAPLSCPTPSAGNACVSGQLFDLGTGEVLREASATGTPCSGATASGPCSVDIAAFDTLSFVQNPAGAVPLASNVLVDDCGFYRVSDFPVPGLGFVTIATDDGVLSDDLVLAAKSLPVSDGDRLDTTALYTVGTATDQGWTSSAGDPFAGQTFSETGVFVGIFLNGSVPAQGTVLTRNGSAQPADDYYFEDESPFVRSTVDTLLSVTGNNGTGLMVGSSLVEHSGSSGALPGCEWPAYLGDSVPGVVMVQEFRSIDSISSEPCSVEAVPLGIPIPVLATALLGAALLGLAANGRRQT